MLPGPRHPAHPLAGGAGPPKGPHLRTQAEWLPVSPTPRSSAPKQRAWRFRSAPRRCTIGREAGIAAHWHYKTGGAQRLRDDPLRPVREWIRQRTGEQLAGGIVRVRRRRNGLRQRLLLYAEGPNHPSATRGHSDRLRLRRAHRNRKQLRRREDRRQDRALVPVAEERAGGGDPPLARLASEAGVGDRRGDRPGAHSYPPCSARPRGGAPGQLGRTARQGRFPAGGPRADRARLRGPRRASWASAESAT